MNCRDLIHPFQNDPGVSQRQRIMDNLLNSYTKIDGRKMADLLDYFVQLSRHINFYEAGINGITVKNWQPFFRKSLPFIMASIIKFKKESIELKLESFKNRFYKKPSKQGLELLIRYINNNVLKKINSWQLQMYESGLPVSMQIEAAIKEKLSDRLKDFIKLTNTAVKFYGINAPGFSNYHKNEIWNIKTSDISSFYEKAVFVSWETTRRKRTKALYGKIFELATSFLLAFQAAGISAEQSMDGSLLPLKEELIEKHPPHLAIIFSFIKLFTYLKDDLNSYTKKHLDFFYKDILKLKPAGAVPDKAHIVFEIQKQLDSYLLKKELLLKDGKDEKKTEILFSTDEDLVVNKAQITDKRTLFLNYRNLAKTIYTEGVYIAPDAVKADGVKIDFKEPALSSWPTLGARLSKYADPESGFKKPYPNARIGFIMASPVLLLNEGTRTVTITIACELSKNSCNDIFPAASKTNHCCEDNYSVNASGSAEKGKYDEFYSAENIYNEVAAFIDTSWYYINRDMIAMAVKKGIAKNTLDKLNALLIKQPSQKICYCPVEEKLYETTISKTDFENYIGSDITLIEDIFKPRKVINVLFSGEKEWISPVKPVKITMGPLSGKQFKLTFKAEIEPDQKAVTFYNAKNLKEDFGTTLPLVKVELDDKMKLDLIADQSYNPECCERKPESGVRKISLYHFFRNVTVIDEVNGEKTRIDVQVCGLKNFIVQNDESVQDVNNLVLPFGVRPRVGSNFYVGSSEIFLKNWTGIWVNTEWKDRPFDFNDYYKHYTNSFEPFEDNTSTIFNNSFKIKIALLENAIWKSDGNGLLFTNPKLPWAPHCIHINPPQWFEDVYQIMPGDFASSYITPPLTMEKLTPINVSSRYGFLRFTLDGVSFQHDRYTFVLARHMMALSNLVDPVSIKYAQDHIVNAKKLIAAIIQRILDIENAIIDVNNDILNAGGLITQINALDTVLNDMVAKIIASDLVGLAIVIVNALSLNTLILADVNNINAKNNAIINNFINNFLVGILDFDNLGGVGIKRLANELKDIIDKIFILLKVNDDVKQGLPKEPYTPALKSISLDYTASAAISDVDLIHLYPYTGTYKNIELQSKPSLFPVYCDEGTLFLGMSDLVPGSNVNILFQLAEATADSETEKEDVDWYYLENNTWKLLRKGFEILSDDTEGLTTSGIVKIAMPANMTNENTILPKGLYWIKAAIPVKSVSVSETIGIYTQAIKAVFTNNEANDKLRLSQPLQAGSLSKLKIADANVKKVMQPFDSFDGRVPEENGHFYVKVSELLRHKGRAIQKFDYERLALEAFPKIYKTKCVNHSFALDAHKYINDYPVAPGYVILAVIPDLNKLKASQQFEPKVPVSLLEDIKDYLMLRTSPFVRLRVMNPRYEKVNFCLKVKLILGKDENFFKEKIKQDLREYLAPWAIGEFDKLTFGQKINRSDIIRFLETRDYIDYITELKMSHEEDNINDGARIISPITPRSILIAGNIDVCIPEKECESWNNNMPCENIAEPIAKYCKEEISLEQKI